MADQRTGQTLHIRKQFLPFGNGKLERPILIDRDASTPKTPAKGVAVKSRQFSQLSKDLNILMDGIVTAEELGTSSMVIWPDPRHASL